MRSLFIFAPVLMALINTACSREVSSQANVRLTFVDGQNLSGKNVSSQTNSVNPESRYFYRLIIQVSGEKLEKPVYFRWDPTFTSTGAPTQPPSSIPLTVPRGQKLLVQAIAVMGTPSSDGPSHVFYDAAVDHVVTQDEEPLTLNLKAFDDAGTGEIKHGTIAGRYLSKLGVGPSGPIAISLKLANRTPVLVDQSSQMIGGWFSVFSMEKVPLQYMAPDGSDMFGGPVSVDSNDLVKDQASAMRVFVPAHTHTCQGCSSSDQRGSERSVYGFFGPGKGDRKICYRNSTVDLSNLVTSGTSSSMLVWNPSASSPAPSNTVYIEKNGSNVAGGDPVTNNFDENGLCKSGDSNGANRFADFLSFDEKRIGGYTDILGFHGSFQLQRASANSGWNAMLISPDSVGQQMKMKLKLLPGVEISSLNPGGLVGVDLFIKQQGGQGEDSLHADYENENGDGVNCAALSSRGYVKAASGVVASSTVSSVGQELTLNFSLSPANNDSPQSISPNSVYYTMIACPHRGSGGSYLSEAAVTYWNPYYHGDDPSQKPNDLSLVVEPLTNANNVSLVSINQDVGTCSGYVIKTKKDNSIWEATDLVFGSVNFNKPTNWESVFSDSECTRPLREFRVTPEWSGSKNFYVRGSAEGAFPFSITADFVSGNRSEFRGIFEGNLDFSVPNGFSAPNILSLRLTDLDSVIDVEKIESPVGQCKSFVLATLKDNDIWSSSDLQSGVLTLTTTSPDNIFYSSWDCSGDPLSSMTIVGWTGLVIIYTKSTIAIEDKAFIYARFISSSGQSFEGSKELDLKFGSGTGGDSSSLSLKIREQSGNADLAEISQPMGACRGYTISTYKNSMPWAPAPMVGIDLVLPSGIFYSDSNCTQPAVLKNITWPATGSMLFWVKGGTMGATSSPITFTALSNPPEAVTLPFSFNFNQSGSGGTPLVLKLSSPGNAGSELSAISQPVNECREYVLSTHYNSSIWPAPTGSSFYVVSPPGLVFSDSTCSTPISSPGSSMNPWTGSKPVWLKSVNAGSMNLSLSIGFSSSIGTVIASGNWTGSVTFTSSGGSVSGTLPLTLKVYRQNDSSGLTSITQSVSQCGEYKLKTFWVSSLWPAPAGFGGVVKFTYPGQAPVVFADAGCAKPIYPGSETTFDSWNGEMPFYVKSSSNLNSSLVIDAQFTQTGSGSYQGSFNGSLSIVSGP